VPWSLPTADVVNRNIKAGSDPNTADFKELTYEAYGVGGVGFIINCLSDNVNRAAADVNAAINKVGAASASRCIGVSLNAAHPFSFPYVTSALAHYSLPSPSPSP
jgi:transcriptional/translational regulatory protein YebC/TACO1